MTSRDELVPLEEVSEEFVQFIPSHLTKGLVAGGISAVAGLVALGFGAYAMREFRLVKAEEILAMLGDPNVLD